VLRAEPDWTALPEAAPAAIRSLLKRCLQKDRLQRLRHITDARFQIEEIQSAPAAPQPRVRAKPRSHERIWWIGAVAILLIVAALWALRQSQRPIPQAPEMRLEIVTPGDTANSAFALSPDGQKLVFLAQGQYWLRPLDSETAKPLPGTENGGSIFWSPDSRSFAFSAADHLKRFDMDL